MYKVTLKKDYVDINFKFETWDGASEFMMIVLKNAEHTPFIEVTVTKESEDDDN